MTDRQKPPNIIREGGIWLCKGDGYTGAGETPEEAYQTWDRIKGAYEIGVGAVIEENAR